MAVSMDHQQISSDPLSKREVTQRGSTVLGPEQVVEETLGLVGVQPNRREYGGVGTKGSKLQSYRSSSIRSGEGFGKGGHGNDSPIPALTQSRFFVCPKLGVWTLVQDNSLFRDNYPNSRQPYIKANLACLQGMWLNDLLPSINGFVQR